MKKKKLRVTHTLDERNFVQKISIVAKKLSSTLENGIALVVPSVSNNWLSTFFKVVR
jgi:hypothetical protein